MAFEEPVSAAITPPPRFESKPAQNRATESAITAGHLGGTGCALWRSGYGATIAL